MAQGISKNTETAKTSLDRSIELRELSGAELLVRIEKLVEQERRISTDVLWHLREIERRRLYTTLGFTSLYDYAVKHLNYSDGAAHRRISAMRLLSDLPEAEPLLESGKISLSTASTLQSFFREEARLQRPYSQHDKTRLLQTLSGKSKRDAERTLVTLSTGRAPLRETERPLPSTQQIQLTIAISPELKDRLKEIQNRLASHAHAPRTYAELLAWMTDLALQQLEDGRDLLSGWKPNIVPLPGLRTQVLNSSTRRKIWNRAEGRCEYQDPYTGERCESQWGLQIDSSTALLQLLCRKHKGHLASPARRRHREEETT